MVILTRLKHNFKVNKGAQAHEYCSICTCKTLKKSVVTQKSDD